MSESLNKREDSKNQSYFRFLIYFILIAIAIMSLSYPVIQDFILTLEVSLFLAALITLSIVGCSIEYRHRSLFMSHYHGTKTIVMDELTQEMLDD